MHGGNLLSAYAAVGRVEGALADAAEHVRLYVLSEGERSILDSILVRLVRLGDTGGATRRIASRDEFDCDHWQLIQKLAEKRGKRLVLVRGDDAQPIAEIAHEALVTAWPYFQDLLQRTADDKRILDALIPRSKSWALDLKNNVGVADRYIAVGADLEHFISLAKSQGHWLSATEQDYIAASQRAKDAAEDARRQQRLTSERLAEEQRKLADAEAKQAYMRAEQAERDRAAAETVALAQTRAARAARIGAVGGGMLAVVVAVFAGIAWSKKQDADRTAESLQAINQQLRLSRALRVVFSDGAPIVIGPRWFDTASTGISSIAIIESKRDNLPVGTGFILRGELLHKTWSGLDLLVTSSYVIGRSNSVSLSAEEAQIYFPVLDKEEKMTIGSVLWSSDDFRGITVADLDGELPKGVVPVERLVDREFIETLRNQETSATGTGEYGEGTDVPVALSYSYIVDEPNPLSFIISKFISTIEIEEVNYINRYWIGGAGVGGSPVLEATTGSLVCVQATGGRMGMIISPNKTGGASSCTWIYDQISAIQSYLHDE